MNDHLNQNDPSHEEISTEELLLLKDVLNTAFPPPSHSLRDGVMEQIRKERTQQKRRRLRQSLVKYGSLAACLLLITLIGIRIHPALRPMALEADTMTAEAYTGSGMNMKKSEYRKDEVMAEAQAATEEASPETAPPVLYSVMAPTASETEAPAEASPETSPAMTYTMTAPLPSAATEAEEAVKPERDENGKEALADSASNSIAAVSAADCTHTAYADSFHTIPEALIAVTGEDAYLAWVESSDGCDVNIAQFMTYIEDSTLLSIGEIELLYDATDLWYQYDWNFELLKTGDMDAITDYYDRGGNYAGMVKRETEYRFKLALLDETGREITLDVCTWSIADLVEEEMISLDTLTAVYEASADEVEQNHPGYGAQEYDLAALHEYAQSPENDETTPPDTIAPGRMEDAMFRINTDMVK